MRRALLRGLMAVFAAVLLGWTAATLLIPTSKVETARVVITVGGSGDDMVNRLGLPVHRTQTADTLVYDAGPEHLKRRVVPVIEHAGRRTVLPEAESLLVYDSVTGHGGIQDINIRFRLPSRPIGPDATRQHGEAVRQSVGDVLQALAQQGWRRYIPLSSPRVAGRDSYDLPGGWQPGAVEDSDPDYLPGLDDWLRLNHTPTWIWYDAGVFVQLSYYRGDASLGQRGGLRASIRTERLALMSHVASASDDDAAIREAYARAMPQLLARRRAAEAKARAAGVGVLTGWRDVAVAGVPVPPT